MSQPVHEFSDALYQIWLGIIKVSPYLFITGIVVAVKIATKMLMGQVITMRQVILSATVAYGLVVLGVYTGLFDMFEYKNGLCVAAGAALVGQEVLMFYFSKYDWFFTGVAKNIQNWFKKK